MRILKNPLVTWSIWIFVLMGLFFAFMRSFFFIGLESDESGISLIIIIFFLVGVGVSLAEAIKLGKDQLHLDGIEQQGLVYLEQKSGRIPELLNKIVTLREKQQPIEVSTIIDSFDTYHGATIRSLSITSTILVTFGLIGTMIGLISSISGLNVLINSIGTSQTELMRGMQKTINGMGIAFYTTFFGAFFGGILLKILSASLLSSLSKLSARLQGYITLELAPDSLPDVVASLNREIKEMSTVWKQMTIEMSESWRSMSGTMSGVTDAISVQMESFSRSIISAEGTVNQYTDKLGSASGRIADTFAGASETIASSLKNLEGAIETSQSGISRFSMELQQSCKDMLNQLSVSASGAADALKEVGQSVSGSGENIQSGFNKSIVSMENFSKELTQVVHSISSAFASFGGTAKTVDGQLQTSSQNIGHSFSQMTSEVEKAASLFQKGMDSIVRSFSAVGAQTDHYASQSQKMSQDSQQAFVNFNHAVQNSENGLKIFTETLSRVPWESMNREIEGSTSHVAEALKKFINTLDSVDQQIKRFTKVVLTQKVKTDSDNNEI